MIPSNPPPTTYLPVTTHLPHSPSLLPRNLLLLPQPRRRPPRLADALVLCSFASSTTVPPTPPRPAPTPSTLASTSASPKSKP
ncbi:hypothetical protein OROMI_015124 [Orobanche minor]